MKHTKPSGRFEQSVMIGIIFKVVRDGTVVLSREGSDRAACDRMSRSACFPLRILNLTVKELFCQGTLPSQLFKEQHGKFEEAVAVFLCSVSPAPQQHCLLP